MSVLPAHDSHWLLLAPQPITEKAITMSVTIAAICQGGAAYLYSIPCPKPFIALLPATVNKIFFVARLKDATCVAEFPSSLLGSN